VAWQVNSHIICHEYSIDQIGGLSLLKDREFVEIVVLYWPVNALKKNRSGDWIKSEVLGIKRHTWWAIVGNFKITGSLAIPRPFRVKPKGKIL
jgi:hypothetical protein